jgi:2-polyprenyl-3-methyl-5-hydroxy-6-metoxy-1,4-benzoquinol methylase
MKIEHLLICPACKDYNSLQFSRENIICKSCKRAYPKVNGISRLLPEMANEAKDVRNSFEFQWDSTSSDFEASHLDPEFKKKVVKVFLDDVKLDRDWFRGKLCLDAGCGVGRWTYALEKLGSKVVSFDITNSGVEITRRTVKSTNVEVLQADIFHTPFKEKSFDFIISWGVLHHTRNPRLGFEKLLPLLKNEGIIFIMVYEKYNPIKLFNTDAIRIVLRNFPDKNVYLFCGFLAKLGSIKPVRYALSTVIQVNISKHGLFDCYSTPINHHYTEKEVFAWYRENGLKDVVLTNSTVYTDFPNRFFRGHHRGTIKMRGRK